MNRALEKLAALAERPLSPEEILTAAKYPVAVSGHYASLIHKGGDAVWRQCAPDAEELKTPAGFDLDPLGEERDMPVPRLIHRYPDRVVMLTTNRCPTNCRFCLRKRYWNDSAADISDRELAVIIDYLKKEKGVREVLVSGGDPLSLSNSSLAEILLALEECENIKIIRIGTRSPVTNPARVDDELVEILAARRGLWVATHFNHPREICPESRRACGKLVAAGVPVLNQTVLLKGVNDDVEILAALFLALAAMRVKPHYLFHLDPVAGAAHFATGVEKGLEIMRGLRGRISSTCMPTFTIDLPDGGGKVPLQPDYQPSPGAYEAIDGRIIAYPDNSLI